MIRRVEYDSRNSGYAKVCVRHRASLYSTGEREHYRRIEDECFGIPRGGTVVGLAFGIIILLAGGIWFLQQAELIPETVEIWPFVVMMFGLLIVVGALYGLRRRY